LRKTMVSWPEATAALAMTKATVARSGSSRERVNDTQNFPAMVLSVLSSLEVIDRMRGMDQPVSGKPAPCWNIHRGSLIASGQTEDVPGRRALQREFERREHRPKSQFAGVPQVTMGEGFDRWIELLCGSHESTLPPHSIKSKRLRVLRGKAGQPSVATGGA